MVRSRVSNAEVVARGLLLVLVVRGVFGNIWAGTFISRHLGLWGNDFPTCMSKMLANYEDESQHEEQNTWGRACGEPPPEPVWGSSAARSL